MIVSRIIPEMGLGNQLFVYAMSYALAQKKHMDFALDISDYKVNYRKGRRPLLTSFNISGMYLQSEKQWNKNFVNKVIIKILKRIKLGIGYKRIKEKQEDFNTFHPEYFDVESKKIYIEGYWQNYKYFQDYRDELKQEFRYIGKKSDTLLKLEQKIAMEESIAVHLRLGDYPEGWRLPEKYYTKAILNLSAKFPAATWYVFCEEPEAVKDKMEKCHLTASYIKEYGLSDIEEFVLMSKCKHFIIANSTYSWWAAWLGSDSGTCVIAPQKGQWGSHFYPAEWELIDCDK